MGPGPAERDKQIKAEGLVVLLHHVQLALPVPILIGHLAERLPGRAEDRSADIEDTREVRRLHLLDILGYEPEVSIGDADELNILDLVEHVFSESADNRIESRTISPASKNSYFHLSLLR